MYAARILYPVEVLGPGKRAGIWFCGCPRRCKGCSNPELWEFKEQYKTTPETVFNMIKTIARDNKIDGFTITGGDPMYQAQDLQILIKLLHNISDDILVYTGYEKSELSEDMLNGISVLIDGEYIESQNINCILRGSANQKIYVLDPKFKEKYDCYCKNNTNKIQNFMTSDGIVSVGIHKPNFIYDLNKCLTERGITLNE